MGPWGVLWRGLFWLGVLLVAAGCGTPAPIFGLRPEYPEVRYRFSDTLVSFVKVDSLQPTFRWESFPRPQDYEADKVGLLRRIQNVTYDLKIWRAEDDYPVEEVYSREGLPEPLHKIEEPLEPSTKYLWSIRARFEIEGHFRVTEWGIWVSYRAQRLPRVPNPFYYRFKTPPE